MAGSWASLKAGLKGRGRLIAAGAVAILLLVGLILSALHTAHMNRLLLATEPNSVPSDARLVAYASRLAKPAYASHCASCHGKDMRGDPAKGAPSLSDRVWLYDFGNVSDIERTVLYGIRSGHAKARNITDMPAFGRTMQLTDAEIADVESYVLSLTRPVADQAAVQRGSILFQGKGVCYDCHSGDGRGNPDYGAPDFTDAEWLYGGDPATIHQSIFEGRHGLCPAWQGKLKPAVIRALAVYIHAVSNKTPPQKASAHG